MVLSSVSAGALFTHQGWQIMNSLAAPLLALAAASLVWLALMKRLRKSA